jgi:hypothetical protein
MLRQPIHDDSERPSFFYLLMADSCFQRASNTANPETSHALRDMGRDYLVKANEVGSDPDHLLFGEGSRLGLVRPT